MLILLAAGAIRAQDSGVTLSQAQLAVDALAEAKRIEGIRRSMVQHGAVHYEGPFSVVGDWELNDAVTTVSYGHDLTPNQFGVFFLQQEDGKPAAFEANGKPKAVRPLHYNVGLRGNDPLFGVRLLPIVNRDVVDNVPAKTYPRMSAAADGTKVVGSQAPDDRLAREFYGRPMYDTKTEKGLFGGLVPTRAPRDAAAYLKSERDFDEQNPIVGILSYTHPQYWHGRLRDVGNPARYETQGGMGHMGAYLGLGRELDSPYRLYGHNGGLGVRVGERGEPAVLYSLKLRQAADETQFENAAAVNRNVAISLRILNESGGQVQFANDFTQDIMKVVNLREVLAFWRGWLDNAWVREDVLTPEQTTLWSQVTPGERTQWLAVADKIRLKGRDKLLANEEVLARKLEEFTFYYKLRSETIWFNYCAEFVTLGYNVGTNLLHNPDSYREAYATDGARLYDLAQWAYREVTAQLEGKSQARGGGWGFRPVPKGEFTPLHGSDRKLMAETGSIIDRPSARVWGASLVWPPQKTIDIIAAFMSTYVAWRDVGAATSGVIALTFARTAMQRLNISLEQFLGVAAPIVGSMLLHEAAWKNVPMLATFEAWTQFVTLSLQGIKAAVTTQLNPQGDEVATLDAAFLALQSELLAAPPAVARPTLISKNPFLRGRGIVQFIHVGAPIFSNEDKKAIVMTLYKADIRDDLRRGRRIGVRTSTDPNAGMFNMFVEDYSPPAIVQRITHGFHPKHPRVELVAQGTLVDATEARRKLPNEIHGRNAAGELVQFRSIHLGLKTDATGNIVLPAVETGE